MSAHTITRRKALFTFVAAAVPQPGRAASGLLRATRVDHVALAVGDIDRAMLFYRRLFGNDVLKNVRTSRRYLHLGPCYLGMEPAAAGQPKRIDHVGIGIADFNPESMKKSLEQAGLKVREGAGLYVNDPDGISIQIWTDQSWTLNNAAPEPGPRQEALFLPRGMHHISIQVSNMARALPFYRTLFGEEVPGAGNSPQPTFMAGETRIVLYNPAPGKPAKVDHFSVLVDNFDAPAALKVLKELGARAELSSDGTLNEFFDPDGIRLQVTHPGQTSGSAGKK
jgi:catechol 2,3-dioxygenase-like lactoylglutathione lyase family enzyme